MTLKGTLFCNDGDMVEYAETQNLVAYPCKRRVLDPMLPQSLQTIFEGGYEHVQTQQHSLHESLNSNNPGYEHVQTWQHSSLVSLNSSVVRQLSAHYASCQEPKAHGSCSSTSLLAQVLLRCCL